MRAFCLALNVSEHVSPRFELSFCEATDQQCRRELLTLWIRNESTRRGLEILGTKRIDRCHRTRSLSSGSVSARRRVTRRETTHEAIDSIGNVERISTILLIVLMILLIVLIVLALTVLLSWSTAPVYRTVDIRGPPGASCMWIEVARLYSSHSPDDLPHPKSRAHGR